MGSRGGRTLAVLLGAALLHSSGVHGIGPLEEAYQYLKCQICEVPQLQGIIEGCCCNAKTADDANTLHFLPILHSLTKSCVLRVERDRDCHGCVGCDWSTS